MSTRVYEYGLLQPTLNGDRVREQMRLAHNYQNALVAIELERRRAFRAALEEDVGVAAWSARLAAVVAELAAQRDAIQRARAAERKRIQTPVERARVQALREEARSLRAALKAAKDAAKTDPARAAALAAVEEAAHQQALAARADFVGRGLYWGTYLLAEAAARAARSEKMDPRFQRWAGEGAVAVQIQSTAPLADLFGSDTRVRLAPLPEDAWTHPSRGERRRRQRTTLSLRIGSDGRAPVWATWPMTMHQPLPEGARVTWVKVLMRVGSPHPGHAGKAPWARWVVQLTVELPDVPTRALPPQPKIAGLDLGWRKRPDGMRVAYLVDSDGHREELVIPDDAVAARLDKASSLRGFRDVGLDAVRGAVVQALEGLALPEPVAERLKSIAHWRSPRRFVALLDLLRPCAEADARLRPAVEVLDVWRRRDLHLGQYEAGVRRGGLGHRREVYRRFAARLVEAYDVLVLEDFDLRTTAVKEAPEEDVTVTTQQREQQRRAAPAELRNAIENAARRSGVRVLRVSAVNTTRTCAACGNVCAGDMAEAIEYRCEHCAALWDQDENAARNLIARGREELAARPSEEPERKRPARFAKRHKATKETKEPAQGPGA